jgi:hypothetical protein
MFVGYVAIVADGAQKQISAIAGILRLDNIQPLRLATMRRKQRPCFARALGII